ncbi:LacI family DNA-binding transcriptional regulator [Microbacterium sp. X-17]|uniref:LacI family DNA-binding transcriptional regulator n=1 Tax=Microbacterium sp. X-17 TaxID=3144404 RepID=UPI0031F4C161
MQKLPAGAQTRRAPTLADIAALSGVATSTVSRALSQPERVSPRTRHRIEAAANQLGYTAPAAPDPQSGPRAVALLIPDITNPFFFGLIRSTQQQLRAAGYTLLLVDTEEVTDFESGYLETFGHSAAGFILAATRLSDEQLAEAAARVPLVTINRDSPGVPAVMIDTPSGVQQAAEHLYSLGHRDIVYLAGPTASWSDSHRWELLQETAKTLGMSVRRHGPHHPSKSSGAAAADALVNSGATAAIAFNDLLAIGVLMRLRERGIDVPGRLSVVGCDDIFGADFCNPPLTTLSSPIEQAGRMATDMLLGQLRAGGPVTRSGVVLPTHLVIRGSTGPVAAD